MRLDRAKNSSFAFGKLGSVARQPSFGNKNLGANILSNHMKNINDVEDEIGDLDDPDESYKPSFLKNGMPSINADDVLATAPPNLFSNLTGVMPLKKNSSHNAEDTRGKLNTGNSHSKIH